MSEGRCLVDDGVARSIIQLDLLQLLASSLRILIKVDADLLGVVELDGTPKFAVLASGNESNMVYLPCEVLSTCVQVLDIIAGIALSE
jgi:hypothetical protein